MRDYTYIDKYYDELLGDVYAQPTDSGHTKLSNEVIREWIFPLHISSVLDVGAGEGDAQILLEQKGIGYTGIAIGEDVVKGKKAGHNLVEGDFNFLSYTGFDLVLSRHSLEHSPFPLITLMEWHRVSNHYLCLVLPNPLHYTYVGRNHYSVMEAHQAGWLLRRAGWKVKKFYLSKEEIWFLAEKVSRISYEGWAKTPLDGRVHELERDTYSEYGEHEMNW